MLEAEYHSVNIRTQSGPLKTGLTVKRTLAVLLSTLVLPAAWADDPQQQQMQQQVDKLELELQDMKVQMGDVQKKNSEISDQNKELTDQHQQLEKKNFEISNKVKAIQDQWDQIPTTNKNQSGFVTDGVTLTFGGYLAEENALRSSNLQADINSPFSKVPFKVPYRGSVNPSPLGDRVECGDERL